MQCNKCKVDLPEEKFSANKKICKICVSAYNKEHHFKNYQNNEKRQTSCKMNALKWSRNNKEKRALIAKNRNIKEKINFPEKIKCRNLVNQKVRFGRMPKASTLKCSYCEKQAAHYHHHKGYSFENRYDVVPICAKCHSSIG